MESDRVKGDVAVVVGAAQGIGKTTAIKLADNGAEVACLDINKEGIDETVKEIEEIGGKAFGVQMDISDSQQVKEAMKKVYDKTSKISILVTTAGIADFTQIEELGDDAWQKVLDINLSGYFYCLREAYPYLKESGKGRIVMFGSSTGFSGSSFAGPHYTVTKAAVPGLVKYVARRWAKDNIRANAIAPGLTLTNLAKNPDGTLSRPMEQVESDVPLGRIGYPEDQANAVMFLVSDESSYMTATTLHVNGGKYTYGT